MNKLEYIPGKAGSSAIPMDGPTAFVGTAENLRSREWSYELGYRDLLSAVRAAREVTVNYHTDYATADTLRRAADADVYARTPGTFVAQGEWKQRGYILAAQPQMIHFGRLETELTIALVDGAWWRLVTREFMADDGTAGGTFLDYEYDYEYDYSRVVYASNVTPSVLTPSDVFMRVYGPAENPYVIVGDNRYQLDMTIPAGGYVTVDGRDKTITLTLADGTTSNAFQYGSRGSGLGGGEYIFEPVHADTQDVAWPGTFNFTLGWYEEEGEPPWSQS